MFWSNRGKICKTCPYWPLEQLNKPPVHCFTDRRVAKYENHMLAVLPTCLPADRQNHLFAVLPTESYGLTSESAVMLCTISERHCFSLIFGWNVSNRKSSVQRCCFLTYNLPNCDNKTLNLLSFSAGLCHGR